MFLIKCICGETFYVDARYIRLAVVCGKCSRTIHITNSNAPPPPSVSENVVENTPQQLERSILKHRITPIISIASLLIGLTLTVINLRQQHSSQSLSSLTGPSPSVERLAPVSVSDTASSSNSKAQSTPAKAALAPSLSNANISVPVRQPSPISIAELKTDESTFDYDFDREVIVPAPTPETFRYGNGTNLIPARAIGGRGVLQISNGTGSDAIAKIVDVRTDRAIRLVYIRASSDITINNIPEGDYELKFSMGRDYNRDTSKFLNSQSYSKFDDILNFKEVRTSEGIEWSEFSLTLHQVVGGNAQTSSISKTEFDSN